MASDSGSAPGQNGQDGGPLGPRVPGRHAAPRRTVRKRLQLPVGRALALTAVPTALLMGAIAPKLALASDARAATTTSSTETAGSGAEGAACTKTSLQALEKGTVPTTTASGTTSTGTTTTHKSQSTAGKAATANTQSGTTASKAPTAPTAPTSPAPTASAPAGAPKSPQPGGQPTTAPTTAPTTGHGAPSQPSNPILGLLNGIGGLLGLDADAPHTLSATPKPSVTPSASPSVTPSATPAAAGRRADAVTGSVPAATTTAQPSTAPTATASAPAHTTAPSAPASHGATPTTGSTGAPSAPATAPSAAPGSRAAADKLCDIRDLAAPLDTSVINGITEMPSVPWTLKSSNLELINTQFWGVVTVPTGAGDVRVLKFTAQEVNIGDLDMTTEQSTNQQLHVEGGPGTTSTMRGGTVTMYVTSLSGTLNAAEGIPLGWLGVNLTLTPDTLPQWLYDLIGDVPIPLTLDLTNAVATQTGQFGGNLTIPGMHLYYTPLS